MISTSFCGWCVSVVASFLISKSQITWESGDTQLMTRLERSAFCEARAFHHMLKSSIGQDACPAGIMFHACMGRDAMLHGNVICSTVLATLSAHPWVMKNKPAVWLPKLG
jgi:hypothetical protein